MQTPRQQLVQLIREEWLQSGDVTLEQLLDGGRELFIECLVDAAAELPPSLSMPTAEEFGQVFDQLIRESAS